MPAHGIVAVAGGIAPLFGLDLSLKFRMALGTCFLFGGLLRGSGIFHALFLSGLFLRSSFLCRCLFGGSLRRRLLFRLDAFGVLALLQLLRGLFLLFLFLLLLERESLGFLRRVAGSAWRSPPSTGAGRAQAPVRRRTRVAAVRVWARGFSACARRRRWLRWPTSTRVAHCVSR
jgi:hypothetical protein